MRHRSGIFLNDELREQLIVHQTTEITEHSIYTRLAKTVKSPEDSRILEKIANDELRHYEICRKYTQRHVQPNAFRVWKYYWISRIFGFTFGVKLLENREENAQASYARLRGVIPEADALVLDEGVHEKALLNLLDEERLRYTGSVVLGLNDALVELTGALAGFTLALQEPRLVVLTGSITGISAALSMGASEYLSTKSEGTTKNPLKAALYTGSTYIATVFLLILPYLLVTGIYASLACTLVAALSIIAFFNYYISVAKGVGFRERFLEMAGLTIGVGVLSFCAGFLLRSLLGVAG